MLRTRSEVVAELATARLSVQKLEDELLTLPVALESTASSSSSTLNKSNLPLSLREYKRYGRQMILTEIGLPGQIAFRNASILVIGAGALGCPVLLYLAAAGIGKITIIDHDNIELSNLHRQVLHSEAKIGMNKAESARRGLLALNSDIEIIDLPVAFTPSLFSPSTSTPPSLLHPTFSLILDCTDNPATRHLINAYATAYNIPLVSGGAVRSEGVVGVYNLPLPPTPSTSSSTRSTSTSTSTTNESKEELSSVRGPCYACIFPPVVKSDPPLSEEQIALAGTGACSDEGVLGVVCGMVGLGMAGETIKVLLGIATPTLHLLSPLSPSPFRTIKLRLRQLNCPTCSTSLDSTPLTRWKELLQTGEWKDWEDPLCELPGVGEKVLNSRDRIRVNDLTLRKGERLIDVRSKTEFGICHLPGSINVPFPILLKTPSLALDPTSSSLPSDSNPDSIIFVCKKGNDSFLAAKALRRYLKKESETVVVEQEGSNNMKNVNEDVIVKDLIGGIQAWSKEIDEKFPVY